MLDLSGENLVTYLLRELKDIVNRHPRFRNLGGDVFIQAANLISWGDLQVEISNVQASGNRLSPDYFMCTQHGYAVLAKLEGKDGVFVEWVRELRNETDDLGNLTNPIAGVYYLNVDAVNEGTREVDLTMETYRWASGVLGPGKGSSTTIAPGINPAAVYPVNSTINFTHYGSSVYITSYTTDQPVQLRTATETLIPNVDYWYQREEVRSLGATVGGYQDFDLPITDYLSIKIYDQYGYVLRDGIDFNFISASRIRLGVWTPPGYELSATFLVKKDPTTVKVVHEENKLPNMVVNPNEQLATGQIYLISSYDGTIYSEQDLLVLGDGTVWLKNLLRYNESLTWEGRISAGQTEIKAKKMASNTHIIDGLSVGIGDMVNVDDQVVILVSPNSTETYEVYGSKENVSFDIRVKANDRMTASEIASMIRSHLTVRDRDEMETNGVSIFEVSKAVSVEQKTAAGTSTSTTYTLSVQAAVDWELYLPLITRIGYLQMDIEVGMPGWNSTAYPGSPSIMPRLVTAGRPAFVPYYT
jgi:hypothetical protein